MTNIKTIKELNRVATWGKGVLRDKMFAKVLRVYTVELLEGLKGSERLTELSPPYVKGEIEVLEQNRGYNQKVQELKEAINKILK